MPVLKSVNLVAKVVWLGRVTEQETDLRSEPLNEAHLSFEGLAGEVHSGLTRSSCVRVKKLYETGTPIRNTRQLSVISSEEMAEVAKALGLDRMDPTWLGASMVIEGIPDFTRVPPSSRLIFSSGASLCVDMENRPCIYPGREIEKDFPGAGPKFKPAAEGLRGIAGWVEREGDVAIGDAIELFVPDQPQWALFSGTG